VMESNVPISRDFYSGADQPVPDMISRDHDVVVVKRTFNLGYWEFGMGREWGGVEKGGVSLRVT
jgi:hypothetical protein